MALPLPWLFLLGLFLPVALAVPLLYEFRRSQDTGPRVFPDTTLDLHKRRTTSGKWRGGEEPQVRPGLVHEPGDVEVLPETEMEANLVVRGRLTVGRVATLNGSAKTGGGVRLLEGAKVFGNLVCDGAVDLGRMAYVQGVVHARGNVTLRPGSVVKGLYTDGRVDVHPGAEILEDVIARQGVHLVVPGREEEAVADLESLNALLSPEEWDWEGDT